MMAGVTTFQARDWQADHQTPAWSQKARGKYSAKSGQINGGQHVHTACQGDDEAQLLQDQIGSCMRMLSNQDASNAERNCKYTTS